MNKFIINLLLFLTFTILFYVIFLFIWGSYAPTEFKPNVNYRIGSSGHMHSRLSEVKNVKDIDILFLGSSHTYRGFDPRIFSSSGLKTFNLGSSAQTPFQTKVLLDRYLENLNPKTVIYEVYPVTFTIDGVESSLDIIANDSNDLFSLEMAFKIHNIKTYNTLIYGFIHDVLNLNKSFNESSKKGKNTYVSGGFVEREVEHFDFTPTKETEISIKEDQLESFSEIVSIIKNKNIELILVYAPITKVKYDSYNNNSYFDSLMENYSKYYNFNEIMTLNDSLHFYDSNHLNQNGVKLFNTKLIETLYQN